MRHLLRAATTLLLAAWTAWFLAFRRGWAEPRPAVLATLAVLLAAAVAGVLAAAAARAARPGAGRVAAACEAVAAAGLLLAVLGGVANWALGLQGFVVVSEREPVRLSRTAELEDFSAGPLADLRELDLTLALARLELEAAGPEGFRARSQLRVLEASGQEVGLSITRARAAPFRSLFFRQGAFGFAPRVIVLKQGRPVLDAYVPFRTVREGPGGIAFVGDFEVSAERLLLHGAVSLEDLNDDMKGHPELEVAVERGGQRLGGGRLAPGEFAPVGEGLVVGFAGLRRWAEVDFSRRSYPAPMWAGLALLLAGLVAWPVAALRARR